MTKKNILSNLDVEKFKEQLTNMKKNEVLLVKFSAEWCKPCKKIKPFVDNMYNSFPDNIIIVEIDIDESLDLYMIFKSKKMLTGVPTLFAFHGDITKENNLWYVPERSISGSNEEEILDFMNHTINKALSLK